MKTKMKKELISNVTSECLRIFADWRNYELPEEYNYSHLPLSVIDAIFSIGVNYYSVRNTINRFCQHYKIQKFQSHNILTTSEALSYMKEV